MKRITIGGKEYSIEYSVEASLYNECTTKIFDMFMGIASVRGQADALEKSDSNDVESLKGLMKGAVMSMTDIPQTTLVLFYAGLLEHHGTEEGDGSVASIKDAKHLIKTYMLENNGANWYDLMNTLVEQIGADNFFERIGLDKMLKQTEAEGNKTTRRNGKAKASNLEIVGEN